MTRELSPTPAFERVAEIESHTIHAWPPQVVEVTDDGWVLRATPGLLGRGRSNHALTPAHPLARAEYDAALKRVLEFSELHGIECGVQVSPLDLHAPLVDELAARGWRVHQAVVVMTGDTQAVASGADPEFVLSVSDRATPEWVAAWAACDGRADVEEHVQTVFPKMAGIARFARAGDRAVGISVELDGIVGLFCIAVSPDCRRQGLGKKLVRAMLAQHEAPLTYLQVFSGNTAGIALYRSLGFGEEYRYCHCVLPESGPAEVAAGGSVAAAGSAVAGTAAGRARADGAAAASGGGC